MIRQRQRQLKTHKSLVAAGPRRPARGGGRARRHQDPGWIQGLQDAQGAGGQVAQCSWLSGRPTGGACGSWKLVLTFRRPLVNLDIYLPEPEHTQKTRHPNPMMMTHKNAACTSKTQLPAFIEHRAQYLNEPPHTKRNQQRENFGFAMTNARRATRGQRDERTEKVPNAEYCCDWLASHSRSSDLDLK